MCHRTRLRPAALAAVMLLGSASASAGNVRYVATVIDYSAFGYSLAIPTAINDDGLMAGAVLSSNGTLAQFRGNTSAPTVLPFAALQTVVAPLRLNNSGVVAGSSATGAFVWAPSGGSMFSTGPDSVGGINDRGLVVGTSTGAWSYDGSGLTLLPRPAGATLSSADAVNNSGVIVGSASFSGLQAALRWGDAGPQLLYFGTGESRATAVNDAGQAGGWVVVDGRQRPVLFNENGARFLPVPSNSAAARVQAISATGQVLAGTAGNAPLVDNAYLVGSDGAVRLSALVDGYAGAALSAAGINRHGQIAAYNPFNNNAGLLLTPYGSLAWQGTAGGRFMDANLWDSGAGFAPGRFLSAQLNSASNQTAWLDENVQVSQFSIGGGSGRSTLELRNGAVLHSTGVQYIADNGVVAGDGTLRSNIVINEGQIAAQRLVVAGDTASAEVLNRGLISGQGGAGSTLRADTLFNEATYLNGRLVQGRMRVDAGQSLRVEGGLYHYGNLEVFGGSFSHGQLGLSVTPFYAGFVDFGPGNVPVGRVLARDATLRFEQGAQFQGGQLAFSGGVNDVFGRVELMAAVAASEPVSQVIVSGRADVSFWDPVRNNGELRVSSGSTATFFGLVNGAGRFTGSGTKFLEGGFAPGNSPALVRVEGDLTMGANSPLLMELGGTVPGSGHDKLVVDGTLTLAGGPLQVLWWDGFTAGAGDSFDLLDWGTLQGSFGAISLPTLDNGLLWDTSALYSLGELRVAAVPEPGPGALMAAGLAALGWLTRRRAAGGRSRP